MTEHAGLLDGFMSGVTIIAGKGYPLDFGRKDDLREHRSATGYPDAVTRVHLRQGQTILVAFAQDDMLANRSKSNFGTND